MKFSNQFVLTAAIIAIFGCGSASGETENSRESLTTPAGPSVVVELRPSDGNLMELLQREAAKAEAQGSSAFVQLHAGWCGPCRALKASMNDPRMADAFRGTTILRLDFDQWRDSLGAAGMRGVTVPMFFELDRMGRPTGRSINGNAWAENIPQNMAPPLKRFFAGDAE